jgi:hypothetical protein
MSHEEMRTMQPKARWSLYIEGKRIWTAAVGPYHLEAHGHEGRAVIRESAAESNTLGRSLWQTSVGIPCDVVELMRLAEEELARRLSKAAETMDGRELVLETLSRQCVDPVSRDAWNAAVPDGKPVANMGSAQVSAALGWDRAKRSSERVLAMLDAAALELKRTGFSGLRIQNVAALAGTNKTAILRRWPSKVELVAAVLERESNLPTDFD